MHRTKTFFFVVFQTGDFWEKMGKITILGSAAAEGIPAMFCNCRVCTEAWKNGGKDRRMRAAYKLNDHVRIDFGPDTFCQELNYQLRSENLKHLFITHSHEDPLYCDLLDYRRPGFSVVAEDNILNIYGNVGVMDAIYTHFAKKRCNFPFYRLNPVEVTAFEPVELPGEDMTFYPMIANHMPTEKPNFYVIRHGKKWLMIANDTGYFCEEDWQFLEKLHVRFAVVITDCTGGIRDIRDGHMSGKYVIDTKKRLEEMGCVNEETKYFINHFSHNGRLTHAEFEAHYDPYGIQIGFDGLEIEY